MGSLNEGKAPKGLFNAPKLSGAIEWESLSLLRSIGILRVGYFGAIFTPTLSSAVVAWNHHFPSAVIRLPQGLFLTFLGSTFLALGHLMNEVLTPKLIKVHGTLRNYQKYLAEFVLNEDAIFRAGEAAERLIALAHLKKRLPPDFSPKDLSELAEVLANHISEVHQAPTATSLLVTEYRKEWQEANIKRKAVRVSITLCYVAAGLMAAWLSSSELITVFKAAFSRV